jgi:hypothetical protein
MALPGLVAARNLADVADRERAWDNLGLNVLANITTPESLAYIAAVEQADGAFLEEEVKQAIHAFVVGCKLDGTWPAIKASCILAGARTLTGALVPLMGTAPTNFNFVSGDYNRKTGLVGDGSTKQLDSGYAASSLSLNNHHLSVYASTVAEASGARAYIGENSNTSVLIYRSSTSLIMRSATISTAATGLSATAAGLIGLSRTASESFTARAGATNATRNNSSVSIGSNAIFLFSRGGSLYSAARIAFYSIGESLNLALLDARVTDLINAFAAAIP